MLIILPFLEMNNLYIVLNVMPGYLEEMKLYISCIEKSGFGYNSNYMKGIYTDQP